MFLLSLWLCLAAAPHPAIAADAALADPESVPENLYSGELVSFPGPWAFQLRRPHLILVSDQELRDLADPDKAINLSLSRTPRMESLRDVCKQAQSQGARTLIVAFDHFFSQYRPGQGLKPRTLTPDRDEYIQRIAALGKFAGEHGLGLELSLLSPLEIGPAYQEATGESGIWMQYRKGLRTPATGAFSVQMWRQKKWENNKGTIALADAGIRVFAFREEGVRGTLYRAVDPKGIVEISEGVNVESLGEKGEQLERVRIFGTGHTEVGALDKVLVVQVYRSPEMDYFSDKALPYLTGLVDRYADAGVKLNGLYSDEMHIQQDWHYFRHHDHGEFTQRYVSPGLAQRYAEKYGDEYLDFAKYLLYFTTGQEDFAPDLSAKGEVSHVFGSTPEDIRRTALFRARYYHLLQDGVVDLFVGAKRHAEKRMGHRLEARAHATWAESPTIDSWNVGEEPLPPHQYEYTPNFVWSNTVHQAASACFDIFKWGDFLTGNGNDHAEGGWIDRDYYAHALACSTGLLNEVPYSYAAHWGMPGEISHRRSHINNAFGSAGSPVFGLVQGMRHRRVEVLMLYPLDLVAAEERFGSWMTQYGYADMVTQAKLLERGKVVEGAIELGGNRFTTLVATFEPFPSQTLLEMMTTFARGGGRLIWSGPPPALSFEGGDALSAWTDLFGVDYAPARNEGRMAPGREITFGGPLQGVSPQTILTDFVVDSIYPVAPREGTEPIAHCRGSVIGTLRRTEKGTAVFLGYRPRDDQSKSLGYETRNWFAVLDTLGAHPPTGVFPETNDNPEHLSRTTDYLVCRFPNGAVSVARHFREYEEGWSGGFARNAEEDKRILESRPLPTDEIHLEDFKVDGHSVTYSGSGSMSFRVDSAGNLAAFAGYACDRVTVDGRTTVFADSKVPHIGWGPVEENRQVPNGAVFQCQVHGAGLIRLPASLIPEKAEFIAEGERLGSRGLAAPHQRDPSSVILEIPPQAAGRWIYAVPR